MAGDVLYIPTEEDVQELLRLRRKLDNISGPGVINTPEGVLINPVTGQVGFADGRRPFMSIRLRVHTVSNDYLECHTWDGTTEGSDAINVAKPFDLRHNKDNYQNVSALSTVNANSVSVTVSGVSQTWLLPTSLAYADDVEIYAIPVAGTGVEVSGNDLKLVDLNNAGRTWMMSP